MLPLTVLSTVGALTLHAVLFHPLLISGKCKAKV